MVVEFPPSSEGIVLGQPLRLSCPAAPIRRPLEASILPNLDWGHRHCAVLCVLVAALFIVLTAAPAHYSLICNTDFIYRA